MPLSEDQEKVKVLLSEAITVLCRNGLNYRNEFTIEGLLGITLDSEDVFLVNINERVKSKTKDSTQREVDIVQSTEDNSCKRKRRFSGRSNGDRGSGIQSEPEAKKQRSSTSVDAIQISDGKCQHILNLIQLVNFALHKYKLFWSINYSLRVQQGLIALSPEI